jgi:hypothetical protein
MGYKYHTPAEYHQLILETENEITRRSEQALEAQQLAALEAYVNDPKNAHEVANHPLVKSLRAMPASPGWGPTAPQQSAQRPAQPGKLPVVIDQNQRFHANHLKLRPAIPQIDSVGDPKVHSPSGKPKSSPAPVRYGPGGPAIPPNGFWVL